MSRRSRRRQREANDLATPEVLHHQTPFLTAETLVDATVDALPDRRNWAPDEPFRLEPFSTPTVEINPSTLTPARQAALPISNAQRAHTGVCVRREQRREVLFAMRRTGKGARRQQRRYNEWSKTKC